MFVCHYKYIHRLCVALPAYNIEWLKVEDDHAEYSEVHFPLFVNRIGGFLTSFGVDLRGEGSTPALHYNAHWVN